MERTLKYLAALLLCVSASLRLNAQTAVLFPLAQMTGTTNDTTLTIKAVNNPVKFNHQIMWWPTAGIQLRTTNGSATTNLIPNDYNVTIAGVPGSWKISVNDTNVTLNAADIGNLTTYTFTDLFGYVKKIIPGTGITVSPSSGQGNVTINSTGGGGGGGSATNIFFFNSTFALWDLFNGSNRVSIVGLQPASLNLTNFAKLTTNAFDTAGAAAAVTNNQLVAWGFWNTNTAFNAASNRATAGISNAIVGGILGGLPLLDFENLKDVQDTGFARTNLSAQVADNLTEGTIPDARLAANIARTNNVNGALRTNAFGIVDCYTNGGPPAWILPNGSHGWQGNGQSWLYTNGWVAVNITGSSSGGSGTVTSIDVAQQGFSSSGAVTGSGTVTLTQNADKNHLGFNATNIGNGVYTNSLRIGGGIGGTFADPTNQLQIDTRFRGKAFNLGTNGIGYFATNLSVGFDLFILRNATLGNQLNVNQIDNNGNDPATLKHDWLVDGTLHAGGVISSDAGFTGTFTGDGSGLTGLDASQLTGTIPHGALPAFALTNFWKGPLEVDGPVSNAGPVSFKSATTNYGEMYLEAVLPASGHVSVLCVDHAGHVTTNDINYFVATNQTPAILGSPVNILAAFNANGDLVGTNNGAGLTNILSGSTLTGTNLTLSFNGSEQMFIVTNDGPDIFFTAPNPGFGHTGFLIKPSSGGHVTLHMPYPIDFYANASNSFATNATLYFDGWGKTNYGWMPASIVELP